MTASARVSIRTRPGARGRVAQPASAYSQTGRKRSRAGSMADEGLKPESLVETQAGPECPGEKKAIDSWLVQLRPALTAFLLRKLQDPSDLHDALQETSLRAWNYALGTELRSPVSLCFRIAENVAIDFSRSHRRAPCTGQVEDMDHVAADDPGPESRASASQELEIVKKIIGGLPPGCRHVFLLSRSAGLSNPEIAEQCGVSIKLVEKQISRALRELREKVRVRRGAG